MRTWAIPLRSNPGDRGFTLLELVVVLALLGLATALVAPAGFRMIASWRRATDVDAVLGTLVAMGARARQEGRAIHLPVGEVDTARVGALPDGWTLTLETPLTIQANGACAGTRGEMRHPNYVRPFVLEAPFCRVTPPEKP